MTARNLRMAVAVGLALALPAWAQGQANEPLAARRAQTLKAPKNKATSGMQRGTDAAGRGIEHGENAAVRGVNRGSEAASRPVRRVGEAFGRKLSPGSSGHAAPPPVGPQGNAP